jgi:hypothetical protein
MGGIDLLNMHVYKLVQVYYKVFSLVGGICMYSFILFVFSLYFTLVLVNSWILYRRYHQEQSTDKKEVLPLRKSQAACAHALTIAGKGKKRTRGRPPLEKEISEADTGPRRRGMLVYPKMRLTTSQYMT